VERDQEHRRHRPTVNTGGQNLSDQGGLGDQLVHAPPVQPGASDVNLHRLGGPPGRSPPGCTTKGRRTRDTVDRLPGHLLRVLGPRAYYDDGLGSSVAR
jgi:hypothetical protein